MSEIFYDGNTFEYYYTNGYKTISKDMGIYSVVAPNDFKIKLLNKVQGFNAELSNLLANPSIRCDKDFDNKYLYIGKATKLCRRIRPFVRHDIKQHRGGYPIWFFLFTPSEQVGLVKLTCKLQVVDRQI